MNTGVLRGRDTESFLIIDVTGSTGRALTAVEFRARTIRFTGTLGQSTTFRLPVSATEDPGKSWCFENQTSGGFTVTLAAPAGAGVAVAPGSAITAFYDGVRFTGETSAATTGIPAMVSGVSTLFPLIVTNPQIGDAISFVATGGGEFVNSPAGAAIGSPIASGTTGAVLFIGPGPVLAQDATNFFWDDTQNFLGLGTNAPAYRLHVKDPTTFSSVTFELGDDAQQAAVRLYPGIIASGGNTLVETGGFIARGYYWTGAASIGVDTWLRTSMGAVTPTYYLALGVGATDRFWIRQDGQTTLGASTPAASGGITQAVVLQGSVFLNGLMTVNDTVNVALGTGSGTKWGTAAAQLQAWWGGTPGVQMTPSGGTTADLLDSLLTQMSSRGLIAPYVTPTSIATYLFIDPRNFAGAHNDPVSTLTDSSGSSRSATAAGSLRALLQVSSNLSPNGSRLLSFDGVDDSYTFVGAMFAVGSGCMITIAGNFLSTAAAGAVVFSDDTDQRPQLIVETNTTSKYAFRDEGHTFNFGSFAAGWQVLQWVFRPPSGGTGVAEFYKNGVSQGTTTWNWNPNASTGFRISGNAGGAVPLKGYLGPVIITPGDVSDLTREGLRMWISAHY